jgi:heptaprenyl diphosphate synthase
MSCALYRAGVATASPLHALPVLQADLGRVEEELRASVVADDPFLTEVASHLILAGGKRVRPALALTAAATASPRMAPAPQDVLMGAVSVELVHLGSLYHDDVMDDATTRRTVPSVNAKWGNLKAILAGDYLLATASEIAASLGTEVAGLLASTIARLCQGQILELQSAFDQGRTEDAYLASIEGKTASLLATACRIGGIVADLPRPQIEAVTTFGRSYGMAFQIVDDLLDVTSTDEELGKPAGHDLVEGTYTLPVIRTIAAGGPAAEQLGGLLDRLRPVDGGLEPVHDPEAIGEARVLLRSVPAVRTALDTARTFVEEGRQALAPYAGTEAADALAAASEHLLGTVDAVV